MSISRLKVKVINFSPFNTVYHFNHHDRKFIIMWHEPSHGGDETSTNCQKWFDIPDKPDRSILWYFHQCILAWNIFNIQRSVSVSKIEKKKKKKRRKLLWSMIIFVHGPKTSFILKMVNLNVGLTEQHLPYLKNVSGKYTLFLIYSGKR